MNKKIILSFFGLFLGIGFIMSLSAFKTSAAFTDTGTGTGTGSGLFDKEHTGTVTCTDTRWYVKKYYNASGQLVGTGTMTNGEVTASYSGAYASMRETSGGVAEHEATTVSCYDWGWSCTTITASEACE